MARIFTRAWLSTGILLSACNDLQQAVGDDESTGNYDLPGFTTFTTAQPGDDGGSDSGSGTDADEDTSGSGSGDTDGPSCVDGEAMDCDCPRGTGVSTCLAGVWGDCECPGAICGDGLVEGSEECDDQNTIDTDACTTACLNAVCGDGFVWEGTEECEDGNADGTDDCTTDCLNAVCGDGFVWAGQEVCDDGNGVETDACLTGCIAASCGDGLVWEGVETCDDQNSDTTDDCPACLISECGDGYLHAIDEQCDDGNLNSLDGCLDDCTPNTCGDGVHNVLAEQCDDGNPDAADGCNPDCIVSGSVIWYLTHHNANDADSAALGVGVDIGGNTIVVGWEDRSALGLGLGTWIRKYDTAGAILWTRAFDLSVGDDWAADVNTDPAGNIAVTGSVMSVDGDYDAWVRRYDPDGLLLWSATYNSPADADDFGAAIDHDTGFSVTVAITEDRPDLGTGRDILVRRYSLVGVPQWSQTLSTAADEVATGLASAPDTRLSLAGYRVLGTDIAEMIAAHLLVSGSLLWEDNFVSGGGGFDIARAVAVDDSGAAIFVGREDRSDIGQGIDGRAIKYDPDAAIVGIGSIEGPGGDDVEGWGIATGTLNHTWGAWSRPGPGGSVDAYVRREDDTGLEIWSTYIDGPDGLLDQPAAVGVHASNYASVVGTTQTLGTTDIFIARLAP